MRHRTSELGPVFGDWQDAADAYAVQLDALMRREPGAAEELARLSRRLAQCASEFRETGGELND